MFWIPPVMVFAVKILIRLSGIPDIFPESAARVFPLFMNFFLKRFFFRFCVSVWHREADFQSTVSNAARGAREIVRRYDTGRGEKRNKNENNNEAAMGNQSLTVSAITKNNGQSDSGREGGEWKRKLCV
jgi:hypothetical protein